MLNYHHRSHEQALADLFPELEFKREDFSNFAGRPSMLFIPFYHCNLVNFETLGKWRDIANRRRFFEELAQQKGFSHSEANMWYTISGADVRKKTVRYSPHSLLRSFPPVAVTPPLLFLFPFLSIASN